MISDFSFSDTIAGYIFAYDAAARSLSLRRLDGQMISVRLRNDISAHFIYNLDEHYRDAMPILGSLLENRGQLIFVYGTYYPDSNAKKDNFTAQSIIFAGSTSSSYIHEKPSWWVDQAHAIALSYLRWQFGYPDGAIDYSKYRTRLTLAGSKAGDDIQETATISRLVYGFSAAYMLTGNESFLEAAEKGSQYLRARLRFHDTDNEIIYWYHAMIEEGGKAHKLLASEFSDDYCSIPLYEQIYALCGPVMTYRLTGDPDILRDIKKTIRLFERFYKDNHLGGYFSHLDPVELNGRSVLLGQNRSRKNWNSIGDHAPAYLINLYLATGDCQYARFLEENFDLIVQHFPDYQNSPFVQERFFEDWRPDRSWGWQKNRAVVGHNLKIAWNLMRMMSLKPKEEYVSLARKIAAIMPEAGSDLQRGGWYDVLEREGSGRWFHAAFHDRKAWWQQEQAILAYYILFGNLREKEYLRLARESAAFYNAFFLDHEDGGIYYNVLANGLPYLFGNERLKGSHAMSMYHSMELCFLSAVYVNLLVAKQPLVLYFKPYPGAFPGNVLRVSPDLLPPGSICIERCWIDGQEYEDFDAEALTVRLPDTGDRMTVKVQVVPAQSLQGGNFRSQSKEVKTV